MNKLKEILKQRKSKKGFTLIELLAVIVVLAIVLVVTIPSVLNSMKNAKSKQVNNAKRTIENYMTEQYEICKSGIGEFSQGKYHNEFFSSDCELNMENATSDNILEASETSKNIIKAIKNYRYENGKFIIGSIVYGDSVSELSVSAAQYITNLYNDNKNKENNNNESKNEKINNGITYHIASNVGLMNDRLGGTVGVDAGNIRYYGANPNNYIYFNCETYPDTNCELWRIIGVFDGKLKLIRKDSIGSYSWDNKNTTTGAETNNGKNDWTTARLMKLLNPNDYYDIDENDNGHGQSLYYNSESGTCFKGQNNAIASCDFTNTGIKNDITRNMIAESTWYLGGNNVNTVYPNKIYEYERGTVVYSGRPKTWTGKIAVMYPSDYGYAADLNTCTKILSSYSNCSSNNWLDGNTELLLTPISTNTYYTYQLKADGSISTNSKPVYSTSVVRPVLYLNSNVIIESGNGTDSDPYRLS